MDMGGLQGSCKGKQLAYLVSMSRVSGTSDGECVDLYERCDFGMSNNQTQRDFFVLYLLVIVKKLLLVPCVARRY